MLVNQNTDPDWIIETEEDKLFEIETKRYDNGQVIKRCKLSDGRIAEARRLKGVDAQQVQRLTAGDTDKYRAAITALCVTIGGEKLTMEELDDLWYDDLTKITMIAAVNFPSAQNA